MAWSVVQVEGMQEKDGERGEVGLSLAHTVPQRLMCIDTGYRDTIFAISWPGLETRDECDAEMLSRKRKYGSAVEYWLEELFRDWRG